MPDPTPSRPPASSGRTSIRVRYCECDPMGVAHHAAYAPWLEIARTELLRESGVTYADLERNGVFLVITRLECKYRRPIYYDDLVEVRTTVVGGSRVKIEHTYEIALVEDGARARRAKGDIVTIASTTLACVGRDGKIQSLPDWLAPRDARETHL